MSPEQVIAFYGDGNISKAAEALKLSRQTLYNWLGSGEVPLGWQPWIEQDTLGRLRAEIRRPDRDRA